MVFLFKCYGRVITVEANWKVVTERVMGVRWIVPFALLSLALAYINISGVEPECTVLSPGETRLFTLELNVSHEGTYDIIISSDGLYVYPSEMRLYLTDNRISTKWIKITAPENVVNQYYVLEVDIFKASDSSLVESKEYCFRVYKGMLASTYPDVVLGKKRVYIENDEVKIELYIRNMGSTPVTVTLDSTYPETYFDENPVIVGPYRERTVTATIPVVDAIPEYVTFKGIMEGITKQVTVRMPVREILMPNVDIDVPEKIILDTAIKTAEVRVSNNGDAPAILKIKGKAMPFGVAAFSDTFTIYPHETVRVPVYITTKGTLTTGTFLSKLCLYDKYDTQLTCRYITIDVPDKKETKVETKTTEKGITAIIEIKNGAKRYIGAKVEVKVPKGWRYSVSKERFDLSPYEEESIEVIFVPEENAQEGTAVVRVLTSDGTVLAQKTVELSPGVLTGYVLAGTVSPIGMVIAAVILALVVAIIIKKGKKAEQIEAAEFEELTKKE